MLDNQGEPHSPLDSRATIIEAHCLAVAAIMADLQMKSRPIPAARAIPWVPQHDGYYLLASVMLGARAAPLVVMQQVLLEVEKHLRAVPAAKVCGILCGAQYMDPRTNAEYFLIEEATRSPRIDTTDDPDAAALAMWCDLVARAEQQGRHVLGWYRSHVAIVPQISLPAAGAMQVIFPHHWQVGLVRQGVIGEHTGAFVRIQPSESRVYSIPFIELLPTDGARGSPLPTSVAWTNYRTSVPVAAIGQPAARDSRKPHAGSERIRSRDRGGLGFLGAILKRSHTAPTLPTFPQATRRSVTSPPPEANAVEVEHVADLLPQAGIGAPVTDASRILAPPAVAHVADTSVPDKSDSPASHVGPPSPDELLVPEDEAVPITSETNSAAAPAAFDPVLADLRQRAQLDRLFPSRKRRFSARKVARVVISVGVFAAAGIAGAFLLTPRLWDTMRVRKMTQFGQLDSTLFVPASAATTTGSPTAVPIPDGAPAPKQIGNTQLALARVGIYGDDLAVSLGMLDSVLATSRNHATSQAVCRRLDSLLQQTERVQSLLDSARLQVTALIGNTRLGWVDGLSERTRDVSQRYNQACK